MEQTPTDHCESQAFPSTLAQSIRTLRDEGILFDFIIQIGESRLPAHKIVLAACSDYFKAMFTNDTLESKENVVFLQDINLPTMSIILDYFYTSHLCLGIENVQEILMASTMLQIKEIQRHCVNYIKDKIDATNCIGVLMLADRCNIPDLYNDVLVYCLENFDSIIEEKEFLHLDECCLAKIISNNRLNVANEEKVFEAVLKWISHDKEVRLDKINHLMAQVRFTNIRPSALINLENNEYVRNSDYCRNLIAEAKNYLLLQVYPEENRDALQAVTTLSPDKFKPRQSLQRRQRLYVVGGWTTRLQPSTERYDPYNDSWEEVSPMGRPRCGVGVAILGNSLYAIGGHDGQSHLNTVERYDLDTGMWSDDLPTMTTERTSLGVVALNGYIYAVGGQTSAASSSIVERYDPRSNVWEKCAPMRERRLGAGVTILNGLIYAVGGSDIRVLSSVECYDPEKDTWTEVAPMITGRKHLGCAAHDGKIYAVGGMGETKELDSAECYDPKLNNWTQIPPMSEKRSGICLGSLDGILYAIGGHNGDVKLNLVEAYNTKLQTWSVKSPMIHERLAGGLAVHYRKGSHK